MKMMTFKPALRFIRQVTERNPTSICILLAVITLGIDFATVQEVRFPLLYVIPIALAAWLGNKTLAYGLSLMLPLVRVVFENLWQIPESSLAEGINAALEVLALSLYVYLVSRQGSRTRQMKNTITTKDEEMQHLRAFTRMVGTTLQGRGISTGLADGVAFVYLPDYMHVFGEGNISKEEVQTEINRFDCALAATISELDEVREQLDRMGADDEIAIVEAHLAMLRAPTLAQKCKWRLHTDLIRAEQAVQAEIHHMEQMLKGLKQEFMRERSADVRDIGRQILRNLGSPGKNIPHRLASLPPGTILVAEELLLSDALQMDTINLVAIVTEKTGPASHVAILARVRRIPAICDITDATLLLASGDHLLVDAEVGTVTVAPTLAQAARFASRKAQSARLITSADREPVLPCVTRDGVDIGLHANIGRPDEAIIVLEHRLDGVGLFRSEYLFLHAAIPPNLEAQTAAYSEVAAMLNPRPVIIRTMDLGGDKMPRFSRTAGVLTLRSGLRGLAYSLAEKTMFRTQIHAIIRAAHKGNVKIMFPMVMGVEDLSAACCLVDQVLQNELSGRRPPIGAMIETPAAAFDIHGILKIVDFVSIGTNDLAHSILAMDRGSQGHAAVLSFLYPPVLRATEQIIQAANKQGVAVSVCGEAASDPAAACLLIGMGVRDLSLNPFLAVRVRHAIRQVTLEQAQVVAKDALSATTIKEVQEILSPLHREPSP
jgi:phosphotransferase system enzyme I (PtsI)